VPACAKACPTESIQFGPLDELRQRARQRLEQSRQRGAPGASLYGDTPGAKPDSRWDQEFHLELRVELKLGPQSINQGHRVAVDPREEGLAGLDQLRHAAVAEAARHLLTHPALASGG
jgi:Fe-S-cluster-containing dehydrogenase component